MRKLLPGMPDVFRVFGVRKYCLLGESQSTVVCPQVTGDRRFRVLLRSPPCQQQKNDARRGSEKKQTTKKTKKVTHGIYRLVHRTTVVVFGVIQHRSRVSSVWRRANKSRICANYHTYYPCAYVTPHEGFDLRIPLPPHTNPPCRQLSGPGPYGTFRLPPVHAV